MADTAFRLENPVFQSFLFYGAILVIKMTVVQLWTGFYRVTKNVFANPEDVKAVNGNKKSKPNLEDEDVERVRRAHLNDMENIYLFFAIGLMFVAIGPQLFLAEMCFRIFTAARIVHSIVYIGQVPQPSRSIAYTVALLVNILMTGNVVLATL